MSNLSHPAHSVQGLAHRYPNWDTKWWQKLDAATRVTIADEHGVYKFSEHTSPVYGIYQGLYKIKADRDKVNEFVQLWCQNGKVRRDLKRLSDMAYKAAQKRHRKERKHVPAVEVKTKISDKAVEFSTLLIVHLGDEYKKPFSLSYTEIAKITGVQRNMAAYYVKQLLDAGVLACLEVGKGDKGARGNKASTYKFAEGV